LCESQRLSDEGTLIFMLYIQTGRVRELPPNLEELNMRAFCSYWQIEKEGEHRE
jgi:hypothetical protein